MSKISTCALLLTAGLVMVGCKRTESMPAPQPGPKFIGPEYLHGTVGSLTRPRGYRAQLVGGYGLVVDLKGTGSAEVPGWLRPRMEKLIRSGGMGSARLGMSDYSPRAVLASENTAVVAVQGIIPPGAAKGTRFDLQVTALPGTQTTSLQGGLLYTIDLSPQGLNRQGFFDRPLAKAYGYLVVNPFSSDAKQQEATKMRREAVVLSGGVVTRDQPLELILNQPNARVVREIENKINARFPAGLEDREPTAVGKSDVRIVINLPKRFESNPARLMELIAHTYVSDRPGFEQQQALRLAEALVQDPTRSADVAIAWEALGKTALPEIRVYYDHMNSRIQMTALAAGAKLGDGAAIRHLVLLAADRDAENRARAAYLLGFVPREPAVDRALRRLVDDEVTKVRLAAYETLMQVGSPTVQWMKFGGDVDPKFRLDIVQSTKPMVFISQVRVPRVVVFGDRTGFKTPMMASIWDNRLMLKQGTGDQFATVFYQPHNEVKAKTEPIAPTVANLVFLLGHRPSKERPANGWDLSYSEVANALYNLNRKGHLEASVEVQLSPLAAVIAAHNREREIEGHPELSRADGLETLPGDGGSTRGGAGTGGAGDGELPMPAGVDGGDGDGSDRDASNGNGNAGMGDLPVPMPIGGTGGGNDQGDASKGSGRGPTGTSGKADGSGGGSGDGDDADVPMPMGK